MTILDKILAQKEKEVKELKIIYETQPTGIQRKRPSLYDTFLDTEQMNVIAEVKRASPSKGMINENVDPVLQASAYEKAGAGAISVLTDRQFFKGSMEDLAAVAKVVDLPLLCKDFMIDEVQIDVAKDHGASVILLIAAALSKRRLRELYEYARNEGLDVLFEVHDEAEANIALEIGARIIGVNNRDLRTFEVDLKTTDRIAKMVKDERVLLISESGIRTRTDVKQVQSVGASAILVGETLMKTTDIAATMQEMKIPFQKAGCQK